VGHVACIREINSDKILVKKHERKTQDHLGELGIDGKIT
jgi:hypothetical protein